MKAAIGKSDKDAPTATNVLPKAPSPTKTTSPSSTTASKSFMAGFNSPLSAGPFSFGAGDTKQPSFGNAPASTPPVTKATTGPSSPDHTPPKTQHESQPTQRLGALGSGLTLTPPPFASDLNSTSNLPVQASTTPPITASHPTQVNTDPSTAAGIVKINLLK